MHVVSGRAREALERWLGALPIALHAEHGFWSRAPGESEWTPAARVTGEWREPALAILRDITARTPGSLIEVKSVALAWHYRMADQEAGSRRANELRLHLSQLLSNQPVEILAGHKVLEIRPYGVQQGANRSTALARETGGNHRARDRRRSHRRRPLRRLARRRDHHSGGSRSYPGTLPSGRAWSAVRALLRSLVEAEVPR